MRSLLTITLLLAPLPAYGQGLIQGCSGLIIIPSAANNPSGYIFETLCFQEEVPLATRFENVFYLPQSQVNLRYQSEPWRSSSWSRRQLRFRLNLL